MDVSTLFRALLAFERDWIESAVDTVRKDWGTVTRSALYPLIHRANMAIVERVPANGVPDILADVDDVFHDAPVSFRSLLFEDARLAFEAQEAFVALGFRPTADLAMARLGLPSCIVNPDVEVREVGPAAGIDDFRRIKRAIDDERGYGSEVHDQMWALDGRRKALLGTKDLVAYLGGVPAGTVSVRPRAPYAVVEDVATHPRFRMRGVGRTMIFEACNRAIQERCEWVLLTADLFDTPKEMYQTLGFHPIGEIRGFHRGTE